MTNHTQRAQQDEREAVELKKRGKYCMAYTLYKRAASNWTAAADNLAKHGENILSELLRQDAEKNERRAAACLNHLMAKEERA